MAGLVKFDFSQLKQLQNKLNRLQNPDDFINECAKELAEILHERVVEKTPVGQYPNESGKDGGTLRRNWNIGDVKQYGNTICIEVSNPIKYAPYVEYGHRQTPGRYVPAIGKKLKKSWVPGQFMLKISADEVRAIAPHLLEDKIKDYLREFF